MIQAVEVKGFWEENAVHEFQGGANRDGVASWCGEHRLSMLHVQ
jgi:hypothetical protein